jgi:hypothetical protein
MINRGRPHPGPAKITKVRLPYYVQLGPGAGGVRAEYGQRHTGGAP